MSSLKSRAVFYKTSNFLLNVGLFLVSFLLFIFPCIIILTERISFAFGGPKKLSKLTHDWVILCFAYSMLIPLTLIIAGLAAKFIELFLLMYSRCSDPLIIQELLEDNIANLLNSPDKNFYPSNYVTIHGIFESKSYKVSTLAKITYATKSINFLADLAAVDDIFSTLEKKLPEDIIKQRILPFLTRKDLNWFSTRKLPFYKRDFIWPPLPPLYFPSILNVLQPDKGMISLFDNYKARNKIDDSTAATPRITRPILKNKRNT